MYVKIVPGFLMIWKQKGFAATVLHALAVKFISAHIVEMKLSSSPLKA